MAVCAATDQSSVRMSDAMGTAPGLLLIQACYAAYLERRFAFCEGLCTPYDVRNLLKKVMWQT